MDELDVLVEDLLQTIGGRDDEHSRRQVRQRILRWHGEATRDMRTELSALERQLGQSKRRREK